MPVLKNITHAVLLSFAAIAGAQAQSTANIYGVLDLAYGSFQTSALQGAAANHHLTKVDGNVMVTSYLGFKGTEDLADGVKAGFAIETFLRPDTGASGRSNTDVFYGRAANVWLQSGAGKVTLGRQGNLAYSQVVAFNPFAASFGLSPAVRLTYGAWGNDKGDNSWSNAVTYNAPAMGAFSLAVQAQAGESVDKSERTSYGLAAGYTSGPLALGFTAQTVRSAELPKVDLTAGQKQNFALASVSFDAGFAKLYAQYGQYDHAGFTGASKIDTALFQIGAVVPVTASGKVLASFGQSSEKPVSGGTTPHTDHNILSLAYDHFLSKRTDVYAAFMADDEDLAGYRVGRSYLVGVRHAF